MVDELNNSLICGRCTYTYWWDNIQSSTFWPYSLGHWLSWSHSNRVLCSWSESKICQQALLEQPPEVGNISNLRLWLWWGWSNDYATLHIVPSLHEIVKHLQYLPTWVPKRGINRIGPLLLTHRRDIVGVFLYVYFRLFCGPSIFKTTLGSLSGREMPN